MSAEVLEKLRAIVGPNAVLSTADDMLPHLREMRGLFQGKALAIVKPSDTKSVVDIVKLAGNLGLKIIPQGGNTGLVGAQMPFDAATHIVLSTDRLNTIRAIDAPGNSMTVDSGVILERIQQAADEHDRFFPLALGAQGSCQIGGNISTNAGGTGVLAYGNTRDLVLGLEVVLADGSIWNGMNALRKNNTGYDLKHLFIGGEGTLGIITGAVLKLFPKHKGQQVAFMGFETPHAALATLNIAQSLAGNNVTGFELMSGISMDFALRHLEGARAPLEQLHPWYGLVEISSGASHEEAQSLMETVFSEAFEAGHVIDAVLATSQQQSDDFWRLRHGISEVQKHEGGSIKHDVSVPVSRMPDFIVEASAAVRATIEGCRPVPFGHLGDGNIHFNVSQPVDSDKATFLAQWDEINSVVHELVRQYGGSISAEHGIGRLKAGLLEGVKSQVELDMMYAVKKALDPHGMFNPGAMLKNAL